ncbi:hypothetical protein Cgig2_034060 [Carnegiea gigantea]|uniref:NADH:quinone oxidoreductase/Mrp antiporter transmembrane domain-containing protein n=1 Tax=Carnegiea gigantea TaxID=171969 RepID=A0A9Q1QLU4_9CARY|nr:hypothetical protein Cgig2_034060 [Carnegiea gigantea]
MSDSLGVLIVLIFTTIGIGFKLSPAYLINRLLIRGVNLMHNFERDKEVRNPLFKSHSPTSVIAFLTVTSKVNFRYSFFIFHQTNDIFFWKFMILENLIVITQTSTQHMLASPSRGRIRYVIIDLNDGYASIITYMVFDMNFCLNRIIGLHIENDNIQHYVGLYTKDPFWALSLALCLLSVGGSPLLARVLTSVLSVYYYLKIIYLTKLRNNPSHKIPFKIKEFHRIKYNCMCDNIYYTKNINEPNYCNCSGYPF